MDNQMRPDWAVTTATPEETETLGESLGRLLGPGHIVLLYGDLGAGKTQLARGLARGLGVSGPITSPTFTLINEYPGRVSFYHSDLFRLSGSAEVADLGLDDYLYGDGVTAVEWPERLGSLRPAEHLAITISPVTAGRKLTFMAAGSDYAELVTRLSGAWAAERG
jgi:tRNA threonylcarbamoyladenosine biosynthesis protein TsaE